MAKTKISITVDSELVKWIDHEIKKKKFASRSHGFEYAVTNLKDSL